MAKRGEKNRDLKERCKTYIQKTTTLLDAQMLAKEDGFSANFSVWLSAFSELLKNQPAVMIPGKRPAK